MSKEHAYAYEAGYRDGSINYELEHCPACKNVADLQEALAENDKLRELLHRLLVEYRYLRVRPRKTYLQHEGRMRAIEEEMRELGIEVDE